ncbi:MAG TPA: SPOR domain-containing protein [Xanthomonadales bacterium]|nr:SPOR domain-containing protein [Xanthomonadales bacterium]
MKTERGAALVLVCLSLVATAAESDKPGGKRICVPSEDGRTWVCGTTDAPPPERGLPATRDTGPSPEPPPFLADPSAGNAGAPAVDLTAPASEPPPPDRFESAEPEASTATAEPIAEEAVATPEPLAAEPAAEVAPEPEPAPEAATPAVDIVGADAAQAGTPALLAAPRGEPEFPLSSEPAPTPAETTVEATPVATPAEPPPVESTAEATIAPDAPAPIEAAAASAPVEAEPVVEQPVVEQPVVEQPVVEQPIVEQPVVEQPVAAPVPADPVAEPVVTETAPVAPEPVAEPSAPVDTATTAAAAPEPVAIAPQALATPPRNTSAFLVQVPTHYTLQLARAPSQSGFAALLGTLGLRGEEAYAVPLSGGGATSWMLLWGDFADIDAARAAAAQLAPRVSAWPRRVAPIQDELRTAGTR